LNASAPSRKSTTWAVVLLLLALAVLRWWLAGLPGYPPDLHLYKRWAAWTAQEGVTRIYDPGPRYDYPPLYAFLLTPAGQLESYLEPHHVRAMVRPEASVGTGIDYSPTFSRLVKLPPLIFDLLLAGLLGILAGRYGLWGASFSRWAPALLFLCHPAVLVLSGYWGNPDSVQTFFIVLAFALVLQRKPELGWGALALGCLMKLLAAPYIPLLALATLCRSGFKRLLTAGLAGLAVGLLGLLPFALAGRGGMVLERFFSDLELLPYTSVNGHNLWYLVATWRSAVEPLIGSVTPKTLGLSLFAVAYLLILAGVWRVERQNARANAAAGGPGDDGHWFVAAAAVAASFFTLSTHMHENHSYAVLPFLILLAGRGRRWAWLLAVVSLSITLNLVNHDLLLADRYLAELGGVSDVPAIDVRWYLESGGQLTRTPYLSHFELSAAYFNALLTVVWYGVLMVWGARWVRGSAVPRPPER
jgi:Gpi18-like mannosyltransferase